jgi:hypothetical protein
MRATTVRRLFAMVAGAAVLALAACGGAPAPVAQTYTSAASGYSYVCPPGWKVIRGEVRSSNDSLVTIQVLDLTDAREDWEKGLPDSITPQLEQWSNYYFRVVEKGTRTDATLGGEPAMQLVHPVRIRPSDGPGQVLYRVARHLSKLYVVRVSMPAGAADRDAAGLVAFFNSWKFVEPKPAPGDEPPTGFVLTVPGRPYTP